ncbi:glycosyltransferase [uncultured Microbacterium sp.]|uniref:glycosyltransferase n=1 Tax=uncultured Microbacterium sp. TaxID=191216 RepID=UPI00262F10BD|nr:glycosyltransferase [uncultured Microbacterium sp.]
MTGGPGPDKRSPADAAKDSATRRPLPNRPDSPTTESAKADPPPTVSVIMPVFNKEQYLEEALRSALSQSLLALEVLVVDDGSDDSSLEVARAIAAQDSRVTVVAQRNAGVASARNHGLTLARGTFVAFLDPDDWYPDADVLRDLVEAASTSGVDIAGGSAEKYVRGSRTSGFPASESGYVFTANQVLSYSTYQFDYGFWRFIYRRDFLISNGIAFPPYRRFQDPPFFVRAMSLAGKFAALKRSTYVYRVATGVNWAPKRVLDVLRGMIDVLKIAAELGYHDLATRTIRRFGSAHIQSALATALEENAAQALPLLETLNQLSWQVGSIWQGQAPLSLETGLRHTSAQEEIDLSFIVPVYNSADWLHECLLSILGQSGASIEIVCVNDGSSDDSMRILREYRELDPSRVRIIDQPNGGLSVARNTGISAARGRYICLLDSDDYWRLDSASRLVQHADDEKLDVLQFDAKPFPDPGVSEADWKRYEKYYKRTHAQASATAGAQLIADQLTSEDYKPSACLYLVRSSLLQELSLRFIPGMTHEDNPFTFAALLNAKRAAHLPIDLYARRVRPSSIMTAGSVEASMRGYFVSYVEMNREAARHSLDSAVADQLGKLLFRIFGNVSSRFNQVDDAAAARLADLATSTDAIVTYSMLERLRKQSREVSALTKK